MLKQLDQAKLPVLAGSQRVEGKLTKPVVVPNGEWAAITVGRDATSLGILVGMPVTTGKERSASRRPDPAPATEAGPGPKIKWKWEKTFSSYTLQRIETAFPRQSVAFTSDGSKLIVGNCNGTLSVYTRRK